MAVTKLMNIKSSSHGRGRHLYNSIRYIINPEKTKGGLLVGGNAGNEADEIYDVMIGTKKDWDKLDGRQGYHFVLSWKPGEITEDKAYELVKEFCEDYLGEEYDYVFSVHDDHDHIHGHIVFNSVSRTTGYKYRYEKGDWEKYIQPVTDRICERHGLSRLEYEKEKKVGKTYAEYYAEKSGQYTWKKVIQSDIDFMISCSESWQDFISQMKQIGYTFPRSGVRKDIGEYITFCAPGGHRRRSDSLGAGYSISDIKQRLDGKMSVQKIASKYTWSESPRIRRYGMSNFKKQTNYLSVYQGRSLKRYLEPKTYYSRKNPFAVNQQKVRRNLLQINRLGEDCRYLLRHDIRSREELAEREEMLKQDEKFLRSQKEKDVVQKEDQRYQNYLDLVAKLSSIQDPEDDSFEEIQDRLEQLEKELPGDVQDRVKNVQVIQQRLENIRKEKRIIRHIKKMDLGEKCMKQTALPKVGEIRNVKAGDQSIWKKK